MADLTFLTLYPGEYKFDIFSASDLLGYSLPRRIHRAIRGAVYFDAHVRHRRKTAKEIAADLLHRRRVESGKVLLLTDDEISEIPLIRKYLETEKSDEEAVAFDVWLRKSKTTADMLTLRRYIEDCRCPFCEDRRLFWSVASHVAQAHGVSAYEFREMAGLNRTRSICSPEYHQERQIQQRLVLRRNPELATRSLSKGRDRDVIARRDSSYRPEAMANRLRISNVPERKERFHKMMQSVSHEVRSAGAKRRTPEQVVAQTERIQKARERWAQRVGPQVVSEASRRHIAEYIKKVGPEAIAVQRRNAAETAAKVLRVLHQDPKWHNTWLNHLTVSAQKRAKVPRSDYPVIVARKINGETSNDLATEYGVSREWIDKIVRMAE